MRYARCPSRAVLECLKDLTLDEKGKPLAEIDLTGAPPEEVVLLGPDEIRVTQGDKLAITVEGDKAVTDRLRQIAADLAGNEGLARAQASQDAAAAARIVTAALYGG